jgi:hypothetical protein
LERLILIELATRENSGNGGGAVSSSNTGVKELFQTDVVETNATLAKAWTTCFRYNNYNVDLRQPD